MEKSKKERGKAKIEYIDFKDYLKLLIHKGYGDMIFQASIPTMLKKAMEMCEELHIDPKTGLSKKTVNTLGKNAVQQQEPKKEQDKELEL